MLLDKLIRIGYILQMVKDIPPNSNRCLSIQCALVTLFWQRCVCWQRSSEWTPSPCVQVLSDECCSSRVTNCTYWQHHLELQALVTWLQRGYHITFLIGWNCRCIVNPLALCLWQTMFRISGTPHPLECIKWYFSSRGAFKDHGFEKVAYNWSLAAKFEGNLMKI